MKNCFSRWKHLLPVIVQLLILKNINLEIKNIPEISKISGMLKLKKSFHTVGELWNEIKSFFWIPAFRQKIKHGG